MNVKGLGSILAAAAILVAGIGDATAGRYSVERKIVQLWSDPGDDMRPEISGTVTAVSAAAVQLEGGATVPVTGAKVNVGDLATFICEEIAEGTNPAMQGCELLKTQPPEKPSRKDGLEELW